LNHPEYAAKPWQILLLFYAFIFFSVFINTVVSRALPKIEGLILILHVLGFFAILIPLVYMAPHTSAHDVFTVFLNEGGFATQGLSTLVAMLGPVFSFLGTFLTHQWNVTATLIFLRSRQRCSCTPHQEIPTANEKRKRVNTNRGPLIT
jgi:amino acid transporter